MVMPLPMNVKEYKNFFQRLVGHSSSKFRPKYIVNFVFSSKVLNFAISFVFHPKRISCVPTAEMEPGFRVTGQRVTGSAIWVWVGSRVKALTRLFDPDS